jgi:hypothetical protein
VVDRGTLKTILDAEGIDTESYSLDGGLPFEAYVLEERANAWGVYYSERGLRSNEVVFESEDEACRHLLDLLLADSTTRRPL